MAIGDILTVKSGTASVSKTTTVEKPKTNTASQSGKIILQPKQTIYGITKQYHISEADLRTLNPDLESHMKIGDEITLPLENIKNMEEMSNMLL